MSPLTIFDAGDWLRDSVLAKNATTATDGKSYQADYSNLEANDLPV